MSRYHYRIVDKGTAEMIGDSLAEGHLGFLSGLAAFSQAKKRIMKEQWLVDLCEIECYDLDTGKPSPVFSSNVLQAMLPMIVKPVIVPTKRERSMDDWLK